MGFLNKILKGLGFEDEEYEEPKPKIKQKKDKKNNNISASFDLNNINDEPEKDSKIEDNSVKQEQQTNGSGSFDVIKVQSQADIQSAVQKLKNGAKLLINIEGLVESDIVRSLDFLTGAVFALNLKIQKIDEKIYLIQ